MADYLLSLKNEAYHAVASGGQQRSGEDPQSVADPEDAWLELIIRPRDQLATQSAGNVEMAAISLSNDHRPRDMTSSAAGSSPSGFPSNVSLHSTSAEDKDESHEQVTTVENADQPLTAYSPSAEEDCAMSHAPVEESSVAVGGGKQPASPSPDSSHAGYTKGLKDVPTQMQVVKVADGDIPTPCESIGANEKGVGGAAVDSTSGSESVQSAHSAVGDMKAPYTLDGENYEARGARELSPSSGALHGSSMNGANNSPMPSAVMEAVHVDGAAPPKPIAEKEVGHLMVDRGSRTVSVVECVDLTHDGDDEALRPLDGEQEAGKPSPSSIFSPASFNGRAKADSVVLGVVNKHPTESSSPSEKNRVRTAADMSSKSRPVFIIDLTVDDSYDGDDERPPPSWQFRSCNARKRRSQFTLNGSWEKRSRNSPQQMTDASGPAAAHI